MILALIGEIADIVLGYVLKEPNPPAVFTTILGKIVPVLSQATGETPEQTAERRSRVEAVFAAHSRPIGG